MEKISVIIPSYQPGEYLFECLQSLEKQTFDKRLFEVLIVLNGPKEPFYALILNFISSLTLNARLLYSEIKGVSSARNLALEQARSDYVVFIDDDDVVSITYLEGLFKRSDSESIVVSNSKTFKDDIRNTGEDYISSAYTTCSRYESLSIFKGRKFFSNCCGKIIPLAVIGNIRFDLKLRLGEDSVFMVELSKNVLRILPASADVIYYVRIRQGSASRGNISLKEMFSATGYEIIKYISCFNWSIKRNNVFFIIFRIMASIKGLAIYMFCKFR